MTEQNPTTPTRDFLVKVTRADGTTAIGMAKNFPSSMDARDWAEASEPGATRIEVTPLGDREAFLQAADRAVDARKRVNPYNSLTDTELQRAADREQLEAALRGSL